MTRVRAACLAISGAHLWAAIFLALNGYGIAAVIMCAGAWAWAFAGTDAL